MVQREDVRQYFWVPICCKSIPPQLSALHATLGSRWVFHSFFFLFLVPLTLLVMGCSQWPGNWWSTSRWILLPLLLETLSSATHEQHCGGKADVLSVLLDLLRTRTALRGESERAPTDVLSRTKPPFLFSPLSVLIQFQLLQDHWCNKCLLDISDTCNPEKSAIFQFQLHKSSRSTIILRFAFKSATNIWLAAAIAANTTRTTTTTTYCVSISSGFYLVLLFLTLSLSHSLTLSPSLSTPHTSPEMTGMFVPAVLSVQSLARL